MSKNAFFELFRYGGGKAIPTTGLPTVQQWDRLGWWGLGGGD